MALAVIMWWAGKLKDKLAYLKIVNELLKIYVDDVNGVFKSLSPGTEYVNCELKYNAEKAETDYEKPVDLINMEIIQKVANEIDDMIKKGFWMNLVSILILTAAVYWVLPFIWSF